MSLQMLTENLIITFVVKSNYEVLLDWAPELWLKFLGFFIISIGFM